jgi:hypothetical protein
MDYKTKIRLNNDVLTWYKTNMAQIYKDYRQFDANTLRLEVLKIITNHVVIKSLDVLRKRTYRKALKGRKELEERNFLANTMEFKF